MTQFPSDVALSDILRLSLTITFAENMLALFNVHRFMMLVNR